MDTSMKNNDQAQNGGQMDAARLNNSEIENYELRYGNNHPQNFTPNPESTPDDIASP